MSVLVEIVCATPDDARAAEQGGAGRIELCTALAVGGVTPSLGILEAVKAATRLPVMAMVRPRGSGFCYSAEEVASMVRDAALLIAHGADGIVFGVLSAGGSVNRDACARLVAATGGKQTVFHRAFDMTPEPFVALETLTEIGVTRILSSGQKARALDGADLLAALRERAKGRIEILPGGGIREGNIREVLARTGCDQVHLAPLTPRAELTAASADGEVNYGSDGVITVEAVAEVVNATRG